jgi:glycosyltransferase involved in cell wall biosynthesis
MKPSANPDPPIDVRLGYLNTRYPALSHTFIQREIEALRARGAHVAPFSVRKPTLAELGRGASAEEIDRTTYLLDRPMRFLARCLGAGVVSPARALRTLFMAQRLSPSGLGMRLRHIAYALEAMVLARLLRRQRLQFVHVHMANNGAAVALLATVYDPKLQYGLTIHGSAEFFDMVRLAVRQKAERAAFVRFISECGRAQVMAYTDPATWDRFHVVHCGLDLDGFGPRAARERGPLAVLAIGRLTAIKGYPILLRALAQLSTRDVPWRLRMAGDGPDGRALEALARRLGIDNDVHFLGPVAPDLLQAEFQRADVLVVSSFMEGIPVVLMEAMAAHVPVVSTRVGGVPELISDGVSGLLVSPGSAEALADALERLHADPDAAARRAVKARETVERSFNLRTTTSELGRLLERYVPAGLKTPPGTEAP